MLKRSEVSLFGQSLQRLELPDSLVVDDIVDDLGRQNEETTIDHRAISLGFFSKATYLVTAQIQRTEAPTRNSCSQCRFDLMHLMEGNQLGHIDIADTITVGQTKRLIDSSSLTKLTTRFKRHPIMVSSPVSTNITLHGRRISMTLMYFHYIMLHVKGYI